MAKRPKRKRNSLQTFASDQNEEVFEEPAEPDTPVEPEPIAEPTTPENETNYHGVGGSYVMIDGVRKPRSVQE